MATDIVQSLFGPSPYDIQRAQRAEMDNTAWKYAKAAPFEAARAGLFSAAGGLAGAGAEALGMVNPQVEQARVTEQAMAGIDPSNPDAIFQRAQQVQDPRLKMRLTQYAQQMKAQQQESALKRAQELAALHKARSEASPYAKINPKDYTQESLRAYAASKNPSDLEAINPEGKMSQWAIQLKDSGLEPGTPEFNSEMKKRWNAEVTGRAKGDGTTFVMPGEKTPIDIQKFRGEVQRTIKPHLEQITAVDTADAALKDAMKGNYIAFQGTQQQLARAFSDSNISKGEVQAAGGDPSLIGASVDYISKLVSGTPSMDTMKKMEATLRVIRRNAEKKSAAELKQQKEIGKLAKIPEADLDILLRFPETEQRGNSAASGDDALINKWRKK